MNQRYYTVLFQNPLYPVLAVNGGLFPLIFRFSFKFKLIYSFFLIKKNQKIKTAPARAKTPAQRLNGNELASLKQISVLIAFVQGFLNARSDEVESSSRLASGIAYSFVLAFSIAYFQAVCFAKAPVYSGIRCAVPFSIFHKINHISFCYFVIV